MNMAHKSSPPANDEVVARGNGESVCHAWKGGSVGHQGEFQFRRTCEDYLLHAGEHVRDTCESFSPEVGKHRLRNELVSHLRRHIK